MARRSRSVRSRKKTRETTTASGILTLLKTARCRPKRGGADVPQEKSHPRGQQAEVQQDQQLAAAQAPGRSGLRDQEHGQPGGRRSRPGRARRSRHGPASPCRRAPGAGTRPGPGRSRRWRPAPATKPAQQPGASPNPEYTITAVPATASSAVQKWSGRKRFSSASSASGHVQGGEDGEQGHLVGRQEAERLDVKNVHQAELDRADQKQAQGQGR